MAAPIIVRPIIRTTPERPKKERDWFAFVISIVSFMISVFSFFFATLLEADDVRIVIDELPYVTVFEKTLRLGGNIRLAVVNSGNRTASVLSLNAVARNSTKDEGVNAPCIPESKFLSNIPIQFGFSPVVLKPGDIANLQSSNFIGPGIRPPKSGEYSSYIDRNTYTPKAGDFILVCIQATVATPDSVVTAWRRPIMRYEIEDLSDPGDKSTVLDARRFGLIDKTRPLSVVYRNQWFGKIRSLFTGSDSAPNAAEFRPPQ